MHPLLLSVLAFLLITISGLIAYIGDWVGRKMGRKRLTLFGLRPRYTAIFISVGAGMIIAALTIILTFLISKPVRDAFLTPLDKLKTQLSTGEQEKIRLEKQLDETSKKTADVLRQLGDKGYELQQTNSRLHDSTIQQLEIKGQLDQAKGSLASVESQLTGVHRQLQDAEAEYQQVQTDLAVSNDRLVEGTRNLSALNTRLKALEAQRGDLQAEQTRLQQQRDDMLARIQELNKQLAELTQILNEFARVSFSELAYNSGQEILAGLVNVKQTTAERSKYLNSFLDSADMVVRKQCVDLPKDAAPILYLHRDKDNRLQKMTRDEAVKSLSERITQTSTHTDVVIHLTTANNVPTSGQVLVVIDVVELYPNFIYFTSSNEVAGLDIPTKYQHDEGKVLEFLVDNLLRQQVPHAAREKKLTSINRRFDPKNPGVLPEATYPIVPWSELLATAHQVAETSGPVRVVANAQNTVTAFSPLELTLDVKPQRAP
ncbi:MAG: DUF3084 domain-containing protein [bacterium]